MDVHFALVVVLGILAWIAVGIPATVALGPVLSVDEPLDDNTRRVTGPGPLPRA